MTLNYITIELKISVAPSQTNFNLGFLSGSENLDLEDGKLIENRLLLLSKAKVLILLLVQDHRVLNC